LDVTGRKKKIDPKLENNDLPFYQIFKSKGTHQVLSEDLAKIIVKSKKDIKTGTGRSSKDKVTMYLLLILTAVDPKIVNQSLKELKSL